MTRRVEGRLFLVGCPRSGTTLLQSALAAHPVVRSFPETHFFAAGDARRHRFGLASKDRAEAKVLRSFLHEVGAGHLEGLVPHRDPFYRAYCRAFTKILDRLTTEAGKRVWLEKTPRHLHWIPVIERTVPGARFIHLVREGKDVVASLYDVTHRHPEEWGGQRSVQRCVERWNRDLETTLLYRDRPGHHVVRYEDFVDDPEGVLRDLCAFSGLPFTKQMITDRVGSLDRIVSGGEEWKKGVQGGLARPPSKFDRVFDHEEQDYVRSRLKQIPEGLGRRDGTTEGTTDG